ncbi:MAG: DUF1559 domain-containing protein [Candidatus Omnitrophica bacterium]|nr:DUF1559 domain-containing protein [Candidatus Omnitrophota bacterium]
MFLKKIGFALIEHLLVIVIIGIVNMLLPSLKKEREKAKQITCANNLRQIGIAFTFYLNDYKEL